MRRRGRFTSSRPHLLLVVLLFAFYACSDPPEPAPPFEALLVDLVRIEGRLHLAGDENPFTGVMVEHYPDGRTKSRVELEDGVLHGVAEGWWRDGTLQMREHFVAGASHGTRLRWYADGTRESETEIVNGQLHGTFKLWHENGELAQEIEMRNGRPHGESKAYFPSGYLKAVAEMNQGQVVRQSFWNDGERRE